MTQKRNAAKSQTEAFRNAARELGCDESEERFDAALKKVAAHKPSSTTPKTEAPKAKKTSK